MDESGDYDDGRQQRDLRFTSQNIDAIRLVVNSSRGPVRLSRLEVFHTESEIQTGARAYYIDRRRRPREMDSRRTSP